MLKKIGIAFLIFLVLAGIGSCNNTDEEPTAAETEEVAVEEVEEDKPLSESGLEPQFAEIDGEIIGVYYDTTVNGVFVRMWEPKNDYYNIVLQNNNSETAYVTVTVGDETNTLVIEAGKGENAGTFSDSPFHTPKVTVELG